MHQQQGQELLLQPVQHQGQLHQLQLQLGLHLEQLLLLLLQQGQLHLLLLLIGLVHLLLLLLAQGQREHSYHQECQVLEE